jgi:hypothetical protein
MKADPQDATSAMCVLQIDGRTVLFERCHSGISPDGHLYMMQARRYLAQVDLRPDRMSSDGKSLMAILRWNGGQRPERWSHFIGRSALRRDVCSPCHGEARPA